MIGELQIVQSFHKKLNLIQNKVGTDEQKKQIVGLWLMAALFDTQR